MYFIRTALIHTKCCDLQIARILEPILVAQSKIRRYIPSELTFIMLLVCTDAIVQDGVWGHKEVWESGQDAVEGVGGTLAIGG